MPAISLAGAAKTAIQKIDRRAQINHEAIRRAAE
jgi:hypothetical protein